jgi:hypothetical protein
MGKTRNAYNILFGKPEGKRLLVRPVRRWEDNIKTELREIGRKVGLDFLGSGYGSVASSCDHGNEPLGSMKSWKFIDWMSDY